jgi:hypothetical protein
MWTTGMKMKMVAGGISITITGAYVSFSAWTAKEYEQTTHKITQAVTSTTWGHFGCIFKATADCAT